MIPGSRFTDMSIGSNPNNTVRIEVGNVDDIPMVGLNSKMAQLEEITGH